MEKKIFLTRNATTLETRQSTIGFVSSAACRQRVYFNYHPETRIGGPLFKSVEHKPARP